MIQEALSIMSDNSEPVVLFLRLGHNTHTSADKQGLAANSQGLVKRMGDPTEPCCW